MNFMLVKLSFTCRGNRLLFFYLRGFRKYIIDMFVFKKIFDSILVVWRGIKI